MLRDVIIGNRIKQRGLTWTSGLIGGVVAVLDVVADLGIGDAAGDVAHELAGGTFCRQKKQQRS